mgnify:CR=1 FL=1
MELKPDTIARLRKVSTATLCTQLFKRGFRNVYIQGISRLTTPKGGNLVGPAFTMRNIPAREDLDQISAFDNPEHPQRKAIESVPPGHVLVLDCRGEKRVASGGQILTTRLMKQVPGTRVERRIKLRYWFSASAKSFSLKISAGTGSTGAVLAD